MFKKRPRIGTKKPACGFATKADPGYWERRLFQNTYTYQEQTRRVRGWAVRIQHRGRRKTFSLQSNRVARAAAEACQIYRAVISQGWEAVTRTRRNTALMPASDNLQASYWAQRLLHRPYSMGHSALGDRELLVHVEHEGVAHYCPLGTEEKKSATQRAARLYRHVTTHGWQAANKMFPRELAVAFHWMDKPLVWTYTTIHTLLQPGPGGARSMTRGSGPSAEVDVAIVEPDAGIRQALSWCIRQIEGYRSTIAVPRVSELLRYLPCRSLHLVLMNQVQAENPGNAEIVLPSSPNRTPAMLRYSVWNNSDELFKNAPGGARFYFLQRIPATRLLDPLGDRLLQGPLPNTELASISRNYFRTLFESMTGSSQDPLLNQLSPREREVLSQLSNGRVEKEIALELQISVHTVHQHIRNVFEKLGVHSKIEAVLKCLQK